MKKILNRSNLFLDATSKINTNHVSPLNVSVIQTRCVNKQQQQQQTQQQQQQQQTQNQQKEKSLPLKEPNDCLYFILKYLLILFNIINLLGNISLGISICSLVHLTQIDPRKFKIPDDEKNKLIRTKNSAGSIISISIPIAVVTTIQIMIAWFILRKKTKKVCIFYSFLLLCSFVLTIAAASLHFNPILLPHLILDVPIVSISWLLKLKLQYYNEDLTDIELNAEKKSTIR